MRLSLLHRIKQSLKKDKFPLVVAACAVFGAAACIFIAAPVSLALPGALIAGTLGAAVGGILLPVPAVLGFFGVKSLIQSVRNFNPFVLTLLTAVPVACARTLIVSPCRAVFRKLRPIFNSKATPSPGASQPKITAPAPKI